MRKSPDSFVLLGCVVLSGAMLSACDSGSSAPDPGALADPSVVGDLRPSPKPKPSPTSTVQPSPSPSPTPTAQPSRTPSPTPTVQPSPSPTSPPVTGGPFVPARTLSVCASGCDYTLPSQAFNVAQDMDLIEIHAGTYNDCGYLRAPRMWVRGVGGKAHIQNTTCGGKGLWITQGQDITIENIEFSGMAVPDQNGAGIRHEGTKLTLKNVYMHDGEEGILAGANANAIVNITQSTFERLGKNGYAHGMYLNQIGSFTLTNSIVKNSVTEGHEVKTRAFKSVITCNILGADSGVDSYTLDMPNGGDATVQNNVIEQGPNTSNPTLVTYAEEGASNPVQKLVMSGNILINDRTSGGTFIQLAQASAQASITGNLVVGPGTFIGGSGAANASQSGNVLKPDRASAGITQQYPLPAACGSVQVGAS